MGDPKSSDCIYYRDNGHIETIIQGLGFWLAVDMGIFDIVATWDLGLGWLLSSTVNTRVSSGPFSIDIEVLLVV